MVMRNKPPVRLERRFTASPERVFDAWLDPDLVGSWMLGATPAELALVRLTSDRQVGGSFSYLIRRHGTQIEYVGRYLQMKRPYRLVFTWGIAGVSEDQSRVIMDLLPAGAGCDLTLTHELSSAWTDDTAQTEGGWITRLEALATVLGETTL